MQALKKYSQMWQQTEILGPSEVFLLVNVFYQMQLDTLVESGTANGISTYGFSKLLPQASIHTFDIDMYGFNGPEGKTTLFLKSCCVNVNASTGDAFLMIPEFLQSTQSERIGVVIDGPKAADACRLANKLFSRFPNILMIAIHDTAPFGGYGTCTITGALPPNYSGDDPRFHEGGDLYDMNKLFRAHQPNHIHHGKKMYHRGPGITIWRRL